LTFTLQEKENDSLDARASDVPARSMRPGSRGSREQRGIIDRDLFDAVQAKLTEQANNLKAVRAKSEALLAGRIYDDRGNRMSPSHARKRINTRKSMVRFSSNASARASILRTSFPIQTISSSMELQGKSRLTARPARKTFEKVVARRRNEESDD
jgi:hypothetical protein